MPKGTRLSQKTYDLIKGWLNDGFSTSKITQLLPDEIRCSHTTISKINASKDYDDYCGVKKEEKEPEKKVSIVPFAQLEPVLDELRKANVNAESQFQIQKEILEELKKLREGQEELLDAFKRAWGLY